LSGRFELWRATLEAIADRPLFGYGLGTNASAIAPYARALGFERNLSPHSTPLRTGVEMGVPGLLLMLMIVGMAVWRGITIALSGPDAAFLGVLSVTLGLVAGGLFVTLLLGGMVFGSLIAAIGMGLLLMPISVEERGTYSARSKQQPKNGA
jgi:O-antigen ligase